MSSALSFWLSSSTSSLSHYKPHVSAKPSTFAYISALHWKYSALTSVVQFDLRHVQIISSNTDSGPGCLSIHTTEIWSSFLSKPWLIGDGISRLVSRLSSIHRLDNSNIWYVGSTHPLFVATDVVLTYWTFYNMFCLYSFHVAFHRDDKIIFQFFETDLHWFLLYLPVGIHFANTLPSFEQYSTTLLFLFHQ